MKYLVLEFKDDYRMNAMNIHRDISKGNRGVSYIAGNICMKSNDISIEEMSDEYIKFMFNGKMYTINAVCVDRVRLERID